jgi:methylated-DNA-[protein]-cysteine S-methyltransferase
MKNQTDTQWTTFAVANNTAGISWHAQGVTDLILPEAKSAAVEKRLRLATGSKTATTRLPAWIKSLIRKIQLHLQGKLQDFSDVPVHLADATDFMREVYRAAQTIPAGTVLTYAELAATLGKPKSARAVGTALGKNPVLLIIPCHRIIASSGKLGGFSAPGGITTKAALLKCEGVSLQKPAVIESAAAWQKAIRYLQKQDKQLAIIIKQVGAFTFQPHRRAEPLEALINAIVSQQLSTKVARTILQRVRAVIDKNGKADAKKILTTPDADLRAAGLSGMKVSYLKDLAQHCVDGKFPTLQEVQTMSDEQIIKQFTQVKGIGKWTVEMYLMFDLGRADIFPVDDYGIRKAIAQLHQLNELPPAKSMAAYGEAWQPYRTVASLYLWRSLDMP